jgi:hypothetical protein
VTKYGDGVHFVCLSCFDITLSNDSHLQFAKSGHTQLPSNAIMITSTISVVLFSTIVSYFLNPPSIQKVNLQLFFLPQPSFDWISYLTIHPGIWSTDEAVDQTIESTKVHIQGTERPLGII